MGYILDVIILLFVIFIAYISAKKGFVFTAVEIVGFVAVTFIVSAVSVPIAETVYDKTISKSILSSASKLSENSQDEAEAFIDSLPKFIFKDNGVFSVEKSDVIDYYNNCLKEKTENVSKKVSEDVIKPIIVKPISLIVSSFLFIVLNLCVHFVARLISKIIKHSFVSPINKALGFIIGIPKGILLAFFAFVVLLAISKITENNLLFFGKTTLNKSYVFRFLKYILPQKGFYKYLFF